MTPTGTTLPCSAHRSWSWWLTARGARLATIRERADDDNRAALGTAKLDLVGVAVAGERRVVDKVVKGASLHP